MLSLYAEIHTYTHTHTHTHIYIYVYIYIYIYIYIILCQYVTDSYQDIDENRKKLSKNCLKRRFAVDS